VAGAEVVAGYEETLKLLIEDVKQLEKDFSDESLQRSSLKAVLPPLLLSLSPHLGLHYWTSPASRLLAKDLLTRVLDLCGCSSTLELLIGRPESFDTGNGSRESHVTSPYIPMATRAEKTTELGTVNDPEPSSRKGNSSDTESEMERGRDVKMVFSNGIIKPLLSLFRSKLTRETWKKQPAAKHALVWTLRQLKHPHLSPHLNSFLPPLLMLVDDHESYHKTLGLGALSHLISNIDSTELRWFGRAEVVYEAIKSMLYIREVQVIHSLHPCLILLLPILEGPPPVSATAPRKPTQTDEVFRILLNNVDFESKIALRKAYIAHVSSYIDLLGIYTARHIKQVLRVVEGCLEFPDYSGEETRQFALRTLLAIMRNTWPRVPYHRDTILKMLLRLVSDLCPQDDHTPQKPEVSRQLELVSECLLTLHHCCGNLQDVYKSLQKGSSHRGLLSCIDTTLANMEHRQL
jgi:hypothetical protein